MPIPDPQLLMRDLVSINSINPDLVPGAPGEGEVAAFIARWLEQAGLEVHLEEVMPGRPNVIGIARGSGGGKTLMLNGHMDVVSVTGVQNPFQPTVENGRMYGRGTNDMKGGLAACMLAAAAAKEAHLRGDVMVTAVMDEEYAGLGTIDIAKRYHADGAIVAETTDLQLIVAHRGFVWLEIEVQGVAAHGSRPDLGVDAIFKMGKVLTGLDELNRNLLAHPTHPLLASGSLHGALIQGGRELSTYPDRCVLSVERRTLPGETPESVLAEVNRILDRIREEDPTFKAEARCVLDRIPLETPEDAELVGVLKSTAAKRLGHAPQVAGVPYWTDAATLWSAGIPSVLFGPLGTGSHAAVEWVDLHSVSDCAEIFLATALEFCR